MSLASFEDVASAVAESSTSSELENCFFILDEDGADERCPVDEILVYFFSEQPLDLDKKLFLQGSVSAMVAMAEQFNQDPVEIMCLKTTKFAIKKVPPFTLILTGRISDGDGHLTSILASLYDAYRFHFGGLRHVAKRFEGDRTKFLACAKSQLDLLTPMLQAYRRRSLLSPFVQLPFCSLPANASRLFMQASQYMRRRMKEDEVFGGCVFYKRTVLADHLDMTLTRWMHNRLETILDDTLMKSVVVLGTPSSPSPPSKSPAASARNERKSLRNSRADDTASHVFPVFLSYDQLEEMAVPKEETLEELPEEFAHLIDPPEDGRYVAMVLVLLRRISVGLIVPLSKLFDDRYCARMRYLTEKELANVESEVSMSSRVATGNSGSGIKDQPGATQEFHFLVTDEMMGTAKASVVHKGVALNEKEERFLQGSSFVHELFRSDETSKVLIGDPSGMLYGRNMFTKEVFYMRNSNAASDVTIEKLEGNAQYNLNRHNIHLI